MTVKQISLITMKSGEKVNLPDALNEAEICFTTDTGEIFIGAPNFGPVQYRSDTSANTKGQGISPYRNIKLLTEFDVTKTITGDFYTQEALDRTVVPLSDSSYKIYTFEAGVNSIIASYSLYDGQNVNLVGELFISVFDGEAMICSAGQQVNGIRFSSSLNSSGEIELFSVNTTNSIYTMYISAKCWKSNVAEWDGTKGNGIKPFCLNMIDEDDSLPSISICTDVNLTDLSDKQFLQYNILDKKWENKTISYSDISGDIPEGKSRISELLDVKLTNLSDGQFLKYNTTDNLWENTSISYSDISGTPPESTTELSKLTDVKLTNLTDTQILQYSGTDQKWENVNLPPTPASWTVSSVAASGSTISDATTCTTSLINVASSDGYSQGVSTATLSPMYDPTAPADLGGARFYYRLLGHGSYDYINSLTNSNEQNRYMDCITLTGSGSGCVLQTSPQTSYIIDSFTINIGSSDIASQNIAVNDTYRLVYNSNTPVYSGPSFPQLQMIITNISNGLATFKTQYNPDYSNAAYKDQTMQDLQKLNNLSNNSLIYLTFDTDIGLVVDTTNFLSFMTLRPLSNRSANSIDLNSYDYTGSDGNVLLSKSYWWVLRAPAFGNYVTGSPVFIKNTVHIPGENYSVGDTASVDNGLLTMKVTTVTSVPTRGIVLPDSQPTGSMVIVKNNTDNKPINVYSTLLTSSNSLVSTIPDSSYKNYETKFIRTDKGWTKF